MHFYFLRHAETDHNKHRIVDDLTDIGLNAEGRIQARNISELLKSLDLTDLFMSPMQRVKETKEIIYAESTISSIVLSEFKECNHSVWSNLNQNIHSEETQNFIRLIEAGFQQVPKNALVIAHGGTFWVLCHLLQIEKNRNIPNCQLVKFFQTQDLKWDYEYVSKQIYFTQFSQDIPHFNPKVTIVSCFIENEADVLILQKNSREEVWGIPGGKLEAQDSNEIAGLIREVYEEVGFKIQDPTYIGKYFTRIPGYPDYTLHIYHNKLEKKPDVILSDEHIQAKWVPIPQFKDFKLLNEAQSLAFDADYSKI